MKVNIPKFVEAIEIIAREKGMAARSEAGRDNTFVELKQLDDEGNVIIKEGGLPDVRTVTIDKTTFSNATTTKHVLYRLFGSKKGWDENIQALSRGAIPRIKPAKAAEEVKGQPLVEAEGGAGAISQQPVIEEDAGKGAKPPIAEALPKQRLSFAEWAALMDERHPLRPVFNDVVEKIPGSQTQKLPQRQRGFAAWAKRVDVEHPLAPVFREEPFIDADLSPDPDSDGIADEAPAALPQTDTTNTIHTGILERLLHAGIVVKGDTLETAAQKVTALLNAYAGIDSESPYFVEAKKVLWLLQRPKMAFGAGDRIVTIGLGNYRIWQAVDRACKARGVPSYSLQEFWESEETPVAKPIHRIGRLIYQEHLLSILDREHNRHIQSLEQFAVTLGSATTLSPLFGYPHYAYVRNDKASPIGLTLEEVQATDEIRPAYLLVKIANELQCEPQELVPYSVWLDAVNTASEAEFSRRFPSFITKMVEAPRGKLLASSEIMKLLYESGFVDVIALVSALNNRVKARGVGSRRYNILSSTVEACLSARRPYGKWQTGYKDILYHRITEIVNEERVRRGLPTLTTDEFFDCQRKPGAPMQEFRAQIHNNLLLILERPENSFILGTAQLVSRAGIRVDDFNELFSDLSTAYTTGEQGEVVVGETLAALAACLNCLPEDIMSVAEWQRIPVLSGGPVGAESLQATQAAAEAALNQELLPGRLPLLAVINEALMLAQAAGVKLIGDIAVIDKDALAGASETDVADPSLQGPAEVVDEAPIASPSNEVTTGGDFLTVAKEVLQLYRSLNSAETAAEFSLLSLMARKVSLADAAEQTGLDSEHDAAAVLEQAVLTPVFKATGKQLTVSALSHALGVFQGNVTGRVIANKSLEDGDHDVAIGQSFARPLSAQEVQRLRGNLLKAVAGALSDRSPS